MRELARAYRIADFGKNRIPSLKVVVFDLVFVQGFALDLQGIHRREMLVQCIGHLVKKESVEDYVLGLARGELRSEFRQAFEYGWIDNGIHSLRRKSR